MNAIYSLHINIFFFLKFLLSRLGSVMCMGVTAGAYILTLFAVCLLHSGSKAAL